MLQMNRKRRKKKITAFKRAGSCSKTGRQDTGVLTDGADFGVDIFPEVQILTREHLPKMVDSRRAFIWGTFSSKPHILETADIPRSVSVLVSHKLKNHHTVEDAGSFSTLYSERGSKGDFMSNIYTLWCQTYRTVSFPLKHPSLS